MKRRFALSALVGLGLCLGHNALAANLPMPAMAPPPPKPLSWTGFYLGGNASFPWTDPVTFTSSDPFNSFVFLATLAPQTATGSDIGFFGGPQLGYNWQMGSFLLGAEADIDWGLLSVSTVQSLFAPAPNFGGGALMPNSPSANKLNVSSLSSVRGRAGWIWNNPDNPKNTFNMAGDFLFYGTGGIAWAQSQFDASWTCPNVPGFPNCNAATQFQSQVHQHGTQTGSVWGGGIEWLTLASNGKIIWGIEYLHYSFKGRALTGNTVNLTTGVVNTCGGGGCIPFTASNLDINDVRVRASYIWN
jgi:outer membrane immunogenic protein